MVTDLVQIRQLAASKTAENRNFRRYLSAHHHRLEPFQILATDIQQQIDCTACANCCRHSIVTLGPAEIEAIARYLGCEAGDVERQYTVADPDSSTMRALRSTAEGCVFLDGNLCMIYEARPKACQDFPHVAIGTRSLGGRFESLCRWSSLCPILYNALESYKRLVGYRPAVVDP